MAVEGDGHRWQAALTGGVDGPPPDGAMSEVHPVEEADRDDGAFGVEREGVEPVEAFHRTEGNGRPNGPSRASSARGRARTCTCLAAGAHSPRRSDAPGS